jgi:tRNA(fMet)-specific endonuclease VapC
MQVVKPLPFGAKEANTAAEIRAEIERKGAAAGSTPIGPYDFLIAATALTDNHILVTHNPKEFQRVDNLKLTDWY